MITKSFRTHKTLFTYQIIEPESHSMKHEDEFLRGLVLLGIFDSLQPELLKIRHLENFQ